MEYQPLRYRLSGHGLTRDYPRIHRVTRYPRVNRPVIQGHSETSDAKGCQERIDSYWENALTYFAPPTRTARTIASIGAALLIGLSGSAPSRAQGELSSAERCLSANFNVSLGAQLPRTAARLNSGGPLKIVAIGLSSTVGLWVLRSAATYPEVMRRDARERQQDQILLDDHRDSRSQWVTAIRADAVRRCAHAPLRQRTY
jgi:hypothetical protein